MSKFVTSYNTKYTVPVVESKHIKFTSQYTSKNTPEIILEKTRSQKIKFTSRLR